MLAASTIQRLVAEKLTGRQVDVVGFMDGLFEIASAEGEIHCLVAREGWLRFQLCGHDLCEVELDACRAKLRMLCARLSHVCHEATGSLVSPYGGDVSVIAPFTIEGKDGAVNWHVRFKNTPSEHQFTIIPSRIEKEPSPLTAPRDEDLLASSS